MNKGLAVGVVLALASTGFGAVVYDAGTQTLTYGSPADLDSVIDPPELAEVQQEFGMTKAAFLALSPQVVAFNTATGTAAGTPTSLVVFYTDTDTDTVTFTFAAAYNWGGYTSNTRSAFSGTEAYHDISGVETQPGNCWFDVPGITVSAAGMGVGALGFCVSGRDNLPSGLGQAIFALSDGSTAAVDYPTFGGGAALQYLFIGYQAPQGTLITGVRCTRPGGGNSFIAIDDLSFMMVPEPGTLSLVVLGGLTLGLRRRR